VISPATLHRDAALFSDPAQFDPDRWLPERAQSLPRGAFIPFGSGDRRCIGDSYAMTEMTTVITTVVTRWRLRPAPGMRVREVTGTLLRPSSLQMIADPRPLKDR
jgi:cytochrome P450